MNMNRYDAFRIFYKTSGYTGNLILAFIKRTLNQTNEQFNFELKWAERLRNED